MSGVLPVLITDFIVLLFFLLFLVDQIGTVLAAYISFGINAANLLSASIMSAPAALAFSKLFYPESEKSKTGANAIKIEKG